MKTNKLHIIWAVVVVIALAGGFFWGKTVGASSATAARGTLAGRFGGASSTFAGRFGGGAAGAAAGGEFTTGQVLSVNNNSLMLQLANGNSENVYFSSSTEISMPQTVPASDIQSGSTVIITGTANSDGSVTATTIQVRAATSGNNSAGTQ